MINLSLKEALDKLAAREISAVELTKTYIDRIKKFNGELNCYITETPERALSDAAASDARRAKGAALPLDGAPIGMKDLFCTKGVRTTAASRMLENFIPEYESTISQKLADAGSVLLGKLNLDEFAMGGLSKTSFFGAPINPWKREQRLTAGGSSGGSSSAVASGLCIAATGTDTGGSIRFPSHCAGLVGHKPTYGICSRFGCIAFASSLDCPGPVARTATDAALMLSAMAGFDKNDSTSADIKHPDYAGEIDNMKLKGLRIGIIKELGDLTLSPDVRAAFDKRINDLKSAGAEIIEVSVPEIQPALAAYYIIAPAEASSNLSRYDGVRFGFRAEGSKDLIDMYEKTRSEGFGTEVKRRMIIGTAVLSSESYEVYFMQAAKLRRLLFNSFNAAFEKCDLILTPTAAAEALPLDKQMTPLEEYALDVFTVPVNLAGLPATSVPMGLSASGLPLGLQIIGRQFDDLKCLQLARKVEELSGLKFQPTDIMGA
ncbi:MAG: Asp-tRNA(Asn)/Glu-tRNA(Gln) amidotransferase subunit GatA [Rickettsiales bacterium]|jgi:aspartyl-tRNA(Asn)/glutamyl-tRNA(Gln) amidotransferase subunit A|nr:Asp-tRNA(Asn)/Glu-tRNA(Gln) amidotransferase subunit GatA [Rickettsiales bacterium]